MIKFNDVLLTDRELIQSYTLQGKFQNCDLSFANIISWRFLYDTQYAVIDDFLVFRFYSGHHLAYMGPLAKPDKEGKMPDVGQVVKVIKELRSDAIAMGHPFLMIGAGKEQVQLLEAAMPGMFKMKQERDFFDYIYSREKLETLSGKHLQSKRNHCNKFRALYPKYEYRPMLPEMIPQCLRLEEEWRLKTKDSATEIEKKNLFEEQRSMTRAFLYWKQLDCLGGTIFVDGKLVAFTYGCPINSDTFDVCVEKADVDYEGAFSIINQEFVRHLPPQYIHINREEDLGEEGLRRAKLSYKPEFLLEKYSIMENEPLADFVDSERIKEETINLWRDAFHDSEDFMKLYFEKIYRPDINVVCQIDSHVVGALQTIPMRLKMENTAVNAAYISGVSVRADMRRQNIGTSLMRQAHNRLYEKHTVFACLIPAGPWLFTWYAQCGYSQSIQAIAGPEKVGMMDFDTFNKWQCAQPCILLHDKELYDVALKDLHSSAEVLPTAAMGMIRIINAEAALQLYARLHPTEKFNLRVYADRDIANNNTYYAIANGEVLKTDRPLPNASALTIGQLSLFIFKDVNAIMTLMMN